MILVSAGGYCHTASKQRNSHIEHILFCWCMLIGKENEFNRPAELYTRRGVYDEFSILLQTNSTARCNLISGE